MAQRNQMDISLPGIPENCLEFECKLTNMNESGAARWSTAIYKQGKVIGGQAVAILLYARLAPRTMIPSFWLPLDHVSSPQSSLHRLRVHKLAPADAEAGQHVKGPRFLFALLFSLVRLLSYL